MGMWKGAEDKENERLWSMGTSSLLGNCRVQITRDSKLHKSKKPFLAGGEWPGNDACLQKTDCYLHLEKLVDYGKIQ